MNPLDASLEDIIKSQRKANKAAKVASNGTSKTKSDAKNNGKGSATFATSKSGQLKARTPNAQQSATKKRPVGRKPNAISAEQEVAKVVGTFRAQAQEARNMQFMKNRGLPVGRPTPNSISKRLRPAGSIPIPKHLFQPPQQQIAQAPKFTLPPPQQSVTFTFDNEIALRKQQQQQQEQEQQQQQRQNSNTGSNNRKQSRQSRKGKQPQKRNNGNSSNNNPQNNAPIITAAPIHTQPATVIYQPVQQQPVVTYQTVPVAPQMDYQLDAFNTPGAHLYPQVRPQPVVQQAHIPLPPRPQPGPQVVVTQPVMQTNSWTHAKVEPGIDFSGPSAYENATQFMSRYNQMASR